MFPLIEQSPSLKRHSLSTGLSKTAVLVRTLTFPTKPLPSRKVSTILPSSQEFFCEDSVATRTTSPYCQIPLREYPLLSKFQKGKVFPAPSSPENIRKILYLLPRTTRK